MNLHLRRSSLLTIALAALALPAALSTGRGAAHAAALQDGADCGGPYAGVTGQPLSLRGAAAGLRGALVFNWEFGDGESDTKNPVTHIYTAPGAYTIDLKVVSSTLDTARCETTAVIGGGRVTTPEPAATPGAITVPGNISTPAVARTFEAGWNLISGSEGMAFAQPAAALYTLQAGDTAYELRPAGQGMHGGFGYWAYLSTPAAVLLRGASAASATIAAPAGQWVLIGNPSATETLAVHGADSVLTYDAAAGAYVVTDRLEPGQGAWALSVAGGAITVGE